jgi:RHS repeat-associated protein
MGGMMVKKADSTEYYNTDPLSNASKIVLYKNHPNKLFVFSQQGALFDSVPLKQGKYVSLLKEKEDVFLLYRGWKELQWQQVADEKRQYEALLSTPGSSLYRSVSWEQSKQQLQHIAVSLHERRIAIDDKISSLIVPEEKYIEQLVADFYKNETSEISYLQGLGFAYTIANIRGQKAYELTDHRGNVMAVVSDKKKRVDENQDGIIGYYHADLVSANDYYPFGLLQPGRGYAAGSKYRYGYNGKENDNEVKGAGNQQDYGMRVYDPRLARFLSVDPITAQYPELTAYQFASNTPIQAVDLDGLESYITTDGKYIGTSISNKSPNQIRIATDYSVKNGIILIRSYKEVKFNDSKEEYKRLFADAMKDGNERTGYIVLDADKGEVSFKRLNVPGKPMEAPDPYAAGDEFQAKHNQTIIANVHTHQVDKDFIGKTTVDGKKVTDKYMFDYQYSSPDADGNTAQQRGARFTIGFGNVDFHSPDGKAASKNNLATRKQLETGKINLSEYALGKYIYNKKE